jgi:hypothetical protein
MPKKKVVRRAWTKEDVRTLKTMAKEKRGAAKIAKALKRTVGATTVKASLVGVSLDSRG